MGLPMFPLGGEYYEEEEEAAAAQLQLRQQEEQDKTMDILDLKDAGKCFQATFGHDIAIRAYGIMRKTPDDEWAEKYDCLKGFDATMWVPPMQLKVQIDSMRGEEGDFFIQSMLDLAKTVDSMPKSTEEEDEPKAYLRYWNCAGSGIWHIYGKDFPYEPHNPKGEQHQAYGHAEMFPGGGEFGYISLVELFAAAPMLNLDTFFSPGERI